MSVHLDADILIMDEVLAVGDVKFQHKCIEKMREIVAQDNKTILYVSHNMESVRRLCSRCIILDHGKLVYNGDTEEACRRYFGNESVKTERFADFTEYVRPGWLGREDVRITSAEYLNENSKVTGSETLDLKIKWKILKEVVKVGIRVELNDQEERAFATAVFYDQIEGAAGDTGESILKLDLSKVMNGEYKTFYTVFSLEQFGEGADLDCVKGIDIVVDRKETDNSVLNWRSSAWGNIRLN